MTWRRFLDTDSHAPAGMKKAAQGGLFQNNNRRRGSALTSLEARVALADHEYFAAATHDFAVAVALFGGLQRRQDFHGRDSIGVMRSPAL
jgi:hypothetical protein